MNTSSDNTDKGPEASRSGSLSGRESVKTRVDREPVKDWKDIFKKNLPQGNPETMAGPEASRTGSLSGRAAVPTRQNADQDPWAVGNQKPRGTPTLIGNGLRAYKYAGSNNQIVQTDESKDSSESEDWQVFAGPPGAKGDKGDKGDTGDTGATGSDGVPGAKGDKGDQGDPGVDGTDGVDGVDGTNGTNGTNGTDGAAGATGPVGPPGDTGATGLPGDAGAAGAPGEKGDKGDQGDPGPKGDTIVKNEEGIYAFGIMESMHATFCGRIPAGSDLPVRFVAACEDDSISRHRSVCGKWDMLMGIQRGLPNWCMPDKTEAQYQHAKLIWKSLQATGKVES